MEAGFKVSGYPFSQIIISGAIAAVCAAVPLIIYLTGNPIHPIAWIFAGGMFAVSR